MKGETVLFQLYGEWIPGTVHKVLTVQGRNGVIITGVEIKVGSTIHARPLSQIKASEEIELLYGKT